MAGIVEMIEMAGVVMTAGRRRRENKEGKQGEQGGRYEGRYEGRKGKAG